MLDGATNFIVFLNPSVNIEETRRILADPWNPYFSDLSSVVVNYTALLLRSLFLSKIIKSHAKQLFELLYIPSPEVSPYNQRMTSTS